MFEDLRLEPSSSTWEYHEGVGRDELGRTKDVRHWWTAPRMPLEVLKARGVEPQDTIIWMFCDAEFQARPSRANLTAGIIRIQRLDIRHAHSEIVDHEKLGLLITLLPPTMRLNPDKVVQK